MPDLFSLESLIAFITLSALEIVLGIDNIVFIVVITSRLPEAVRDRARRLGLFMAMFTRIALLFGISLIMGLTAPLFTLASHAVSGRDVILLAGGLFLLGKATLEIHDKVQDHGAGDEARAGAKSSWIGAVLQIMVLDVVFSLDSVITAVGMAEHLAVMVAAIVAAVIVMLVFSGPVARFVHDHPTIQMLAFSFLLLVGVFLVAESLGRHIDRGYIYFAMGFSLFVEVLNMRMRRRKAAA